MKSEVLVFRRLQGPNHDREKEVPVMIDRHDIKYVSGNPHDPLSSYITLHGEDRPTIQVNHTPRSVYQYLTDAEYAATISDSVMNELCPRGGGLENA